MISKTLINAHSEQILSRIFIAIAFVVFLYLFVSSFFFSYVNVDLYTEYVFPYKDNVLLNVFIPAIIILFIVLLKQYHLKVNVRFVAVILSLITCALSLYWVKNSGTFPVADQWFVCEVATELDYGNFSQFSKGGYVAECPHQLGLITILYILQKFFGPFNYQAFQVLSALSSGVIVYFTYKLTEALTHDQLTELLSVFFAFLCLPLYFYTTFVYGEILSVALSLIGFYLFLTINEEFCIRKIVFFWLCIAGMVLVKKNTIIPIVAMVGVAAIKFFRNTEKKWAAILIAIVAGLLLQRSVIYNQYSSYMKKDAKEIPSILYVAMGTNDDGGNAGWWNGLNKFAFEQNDCDPIKATEYGKKYIGMFLDKCRRKPEYILDFYGRKTETQWNAPMCQSIVMNGYIPKEKSELAKTIYFNKAVWNFTDDYMNIHQLMMYGSIVFLLYKTFKHPKYLEFYVGLIAVFGGFLFSLIWEAKTRYIFPYVMMMLPYAAIGLRMIVQKTEGFFHPNKC